MRCLHTSIFTETPTLEGLPTKGKEDPSPHEMRQSRAGEQPSISWCWVDYYYYIIIIIILLLLLYYYILIVLYYYYHYFYY